MPRLPTRRSPSRKSARRPKRRRPVGVSRKAPGGMAGTGAGQKEGEEALAQGFNYGVAEKSQNGRSRSARRPAERSAERADRGQDRIDRPPDRRGIAGGRGDRVRVAEV